MLVVMLLPMSMIVVAATLYRDGNRKERVDDHDGVTGGADADTSVVDIKEGGHRCALGQVCYLCQVPPA